MDSSILLRLDRIKPGSIRLRDLDGRVIGDLANSIRTNGLLQPILVRRRGSDYEVVFGNHRLEACRRIGMQSIRAVVRDLSLEESFVTQVVENIQRNVEINPLSEAEGYIRLVDAGWPINKIALKIGKSDSYVSDRIGLIRRLHPEVAKRFYENKDGRLTASHLERIARVRPIQRQLVLTEIVEQRRLSVRSLEHLIRNNEPLDSVVESRGTSLYVKLPQGVVERMKLEPGDDLHFFFSSKKRIFLERVERTEENVDVAVEKNPAFLLTPRNKIK